MRNMNEEGKHIFIRWANYVPLSSSYRRCFQDSCPLALRLSLQWFPRPFHWRVQQVTLSKWQHAFTVTLRRKGKGCSEAQCNKARPSPHHTLSCHSRKAVFVTGIQKQIRRLLVCCATSVCCAHCLSCNGLQRSNQWRQKLSSIGSTLFLFYLHNAKVKSAWDWHFTVKTGPLTSGFLHPLCDSTWLIPASFAPLGGGPTGVLSGNNWHDIYLLLLLSHILLMGQKAQSLACNQNCVLVLTTLLCSHKSQGKIASSAVYTLMKLSMPDKFTSGNIYDVSMWEGHLTAPSRRHIPHRTHLGPLYSLPV